MAQFPGLGISARLVPTLTGLTLKRLHEEKSGAVFRKPVNRRSDILQIKGEIQ